jgi:hypothetical protein
MVKRRWLDLLHQLETLYHLRNLEAALTLETSLFQSGYFKHL